MWNNGVASLYKCREDYPDVMKPQTLTALSFPLVRNGACYDWDGR